MKVADIYYQQMEKPDRDYTNAQRAEQEYRNMINQFPDSTLDPRAKQKLRDVQEVLAERESSIGLYYESRDNFTAAIARLETVVDTYPLYSKSDQALLGIGDAYAGQARAFQMAPNIPGAIKERLRAVYQDKAAEAYAKVITRYPMAPHVEDARDRLVAMNRPVPEPTQEAVAENDAEERSRQPLHFTDKTFDIIKHGPTVVEAVHVGEPSLDDPKRTLAPDVTKQNMALIAAAYNNGKPVPAPGAIAPTSPNEPTRSDAPSAVPLQGAAPAGGTAIGAEIVSAPAADPNAVIKPVGPDKTVVPANEAPAPAPAQVNDVKPGSTPAAAATNDKKKPKVDSSDESSSKKKKKKGLSKLNPF
jgi:outer membrane protein assembly factor BamD